MEEKELKISTAQRIGIGLIAVIMVGAIIAGYAAIVVGANGSNSSTSQISDEKVVQYQQEYKDAQKAFKEKTQGDYDKFIQFKSQVAAYNEEAANAAELATEDLLVGDGRELTEGDYDYDAFYIGWCADETVFDSSLDSTTSPTGFKSALEVADTDGKLIEGWNAGVIGMKLGGIREITVPGELAYKDMQEICGGTYKPLKFIVMAVANDGELAEAIEELNTANAKVQYAAMGIDYEQLVESAVTGESSEDSASTEGGDGASADSEKTSQNTENSQN